MKSCLQPSHGKVSEQICVLIRKWCNKLMRNFDSVLKEINKGCVEMSFKAVSSEMSFARGDRYLCF